MDILEQIRANYGSFSRPRQRISDFILNYPEQCCFLSLRSFAQQVGTTEVTVLNFCRGLGLGSYMDLKKALQDYLIVRVNAGDRLKLAVAGSGSAQDLYQRVCRAEREALQSTLDGNSVELLLAFTQALRRARRIFIAAHDFSRFPAGYLEHRLLSLELDCCILDLQARQDMFRRLSAQPPPGWAADCHHRAPVRQRHHRPDPLLRFHRHARGSPYGPARFPRGPLRPDYPALPCGADGYDQLLYLHGRPGGHPGYALYLYQWRSHPGGEDLP